MARKRNTYPTRGGQCRTMKAPYLSRDGKWYEENYCTMHNSYLLDCLYCGREFHTKRPHTKWCSVKCRQAAYRARKLA